jgi:uncharacterized protein YneF (UPF0154 family)
MTCTPVSGHWMDLFVALFLMGFSLFFGLIMGMNIMIRNPPTKSK